MTLSELKKGESARIISIGGSGSLRQHFLDMGLIPGKSITFMKAAPMGDPIEYRVWGYELTLRLADAEKIQVVKVTEDNSSAAEEISELLQCPHTEHPGLGEMGKYHVESKGPLPEALLGLSGEFGNQAGALSGVLGLRRTASFRGLAALFLFSPKTQRPKSSLCGALPL